MNRHVWQGILGLLKHIASASEKAVNSLFDLGVCDLLKQMITYYSRSHSGSDKVLYLSLLYFLGDFVAMQIHIIDTIDFQTSVGDACGVHLPAYAASWNIWAGECHHRAKCTR